MKKPIFATIILLNIATIALAQTIKGTYAIKNVQTGMLLRVKDASGKNGTPLVAYYPENWKCMTWDFKNTGENTYQLQNLFTHKTFQPITAAAADVAFEEQPLAGSTSNQQYEFIAVKEDTYLIKLKGTDLYITPADKKGSVNSAIILAAKSDSPEQLWTIYQQSPTM
ncbi:RICIN domain-containing protein [Mucilaginibacter myungsuensis]|uniref:RICIN domain-containing protein n=1 Tax=Mucilaginibacter myungsuensis TaxID=649104 RepID=A0A929KVV5_9SPHI|nr:RICIN domain-containing protein [Mucilaginibacter myungsuensis]MBE9660848.1 RICIN domain-containing protein [Mucilaginibacter myungsuensis]MDN3600895.1 RICIN domain-containing protein [Mucilaginibacter myungsuensis]